MQRALGSLALALVAIAMSGCESHAPLGCNPRLLNVTACMMASRAATFIRSDRTADAEEDLSIAMATAPDEALRKSIADMASEDYATRASDNDDQLNWNLSVAEYTLALKWRPADASTLSSRAYAYLRLLRFDRAVADYSAAMRVEGPSSQGYVRRGEAHELNLDFAAALADYDRAIAAPLQSERALGDRGRIFAAFGRYEEARRDFEDRLKDEPSDMSAVIWLHIVHMRLHEDDARWLRAKAPILKLNSWPGPAISYFLGDKTAADMLQIAWNSEDTRQGYQRCDGWFYLGEQAMARGDSALARQLFGKTVTRCDAIDFEWSMAQGELRRTANLL